jgi:hypothetical protein
MTHRIPMRVVQTITPAPSHTSLTQANTSMMTAAKQSGRSVPRHVDSVEKLLDRLALFATIPIVYRGKRLRPTPPRHIFLSPSLLRVFRCHVGCTACCLAITLDFTEDEFARFIWSADIAANAKTRFAPRRITVNGKTFTIYTCPQYLSPSCPFLIPSRPGGALGCGFWTTSNSTQPLECAAAPQLMMTTRGVGTTVLMKRPFGRGWAWKERPQCEFEPLLDSPGDLTRASDLRDEIALLHRYEHWAQTLEIPTHLPAVIDTMLRLNSTVANTGVHLVPVF